MHNNTTESPAGSGVVSFLSKHKKSLFALAFLFIQFAIRTEALWPFFKHGAIVAWAVFGMAVYNMNGPTLRIASVVFISLMVYTMIDLVFFDFKHFSVADAGMIIASFGVGAVYKYFQFRDYKIKLTPRKMGSLSLLLLLTLFILGGRNYLDYYSPVYSWLHWPYDMSGTVYYNAEAFCGILAMALFIFNVRGLDMRVGVYVLLLAISNYVDEIYYDPTHNTTEELLVVGVINIVCIVWIVPYIIRLYRQR